MSSEFRARRLVAMLFLVAACSAQSSGDRTAQATTEATAPATVRPSPPPSAEPTLAGGLAPRPGRPALVAGEAAQCIPICGQGRAAGGVLPSGRYQTEWFFGGYMTLETDGSWERTEDSNGELSLPVSGSGDDTYRLAIFLDPVLMVEDVVQTDVARSAGDYVRWLSKNRDLRASAPIRTTIGTVPAIAVDIRLAADAPKQYPDCPDRCVTFIKVPAFDHSDGILGDDVYRFYFADVTYSGSDHLLAVKVEGRNAADLEGLLPRVDALLKTFIVPAVPTTAR